MPSHPTTNVPAASPPVRVERVSRVPGEAAFTLIEVLIAMLIAMIMTGIVMYLFSQTQRGTRLSLARAQLMLTANTVDSRLRMDVATMVGPDRTTSAAVAAPTAGGCLLVIPALREGYVPLLNGQMSRNKVRLRSDQLVFMSKRDPGTPHPWVSMLPLPQNQAPGTTSISPSSSWEARIWYGAVQDGTLIAGDGSSGDPGLHAHLWQVGRQAKLLVQDQKGGALDCTVTPDDDTTAGGLVKPTAATAWPGLKDTVLAGGWTDDAYVSNLAMPMSPAQQLNHATPPVTTPVIDLKRLQQGDAASGLQLADVANSHLRLFENCSEFVVQWAGDLDKEGNLDTYPAGHPLAGALIWYPEELHTNAQKDATTRTRLSGPLLAKYDAIAANPWFRSFPAGFAPYLEVWPQGRFGGYTAPPVPTAPAWLSRFQFDYGETDNKPNQTGNAAANVPRPYVFRFDDDQYRLVRYGFRQDGSCYLNRWDGSALPLGDKHWFPYPPTVGTGMTNGFATYYNGKAAPAGPYPVASATAAAAAGTNFGDLMGGTCLPADCNTRTYRTGPCTASVNGLLVTVANAAIPAAPGASNNFALPGAAMTLALGAASAAGAEPLWPYYANGNLVAIRQVDGRVIANVAKPAGDLTEDTVTPPNPPAGSPVPGPPALPPGPPPSAANQAGPMAQQFGPDNNFTVTYTDIWAEYLKTINDPAKAGTREDWRNPQSDWPRLIRLRVRLHDTQGLVSSYSDEFLVNGRDDDGDGVVDNPEEGRISGMWFEYIFAVPHPVDPTPRAH